MTSGRPETSNLQGSHSQTVPVKLLSASIRWGPSWSVCLGTHQFRLQRAAEESTAASADEHSANKMLSAMITSR